MSNLWLPLAEQAPAILSLVLTLAVTYLTRMLHKRMAAGAARDAAIELVTQSELVVRNVAQTAKPAIMEAARAGTLEGHWGAELKAIAMAELESQLSNAAQRVIKSNGTRLEDALSRAIEAAVQKQKTEPQPDPGLVVKGG